MNLTEIKFQICENTDCEIIELISDSTKEFCYSVTVGFNWTTNYNLNLVNDSNANSNIEFHKIKILN